MLDFLICLLYVWIGNFIIFKIFKYIEFELISFKIVYFLNVLFEQENSYLVNFNFFYLDKVV